MTVTDLIARLKELPSDLEVVLYCDWSGSVADVFIENGKRVILADYIPKKGSV